MGFLGGKGTTPLKTVYTNPIGKHATKGGGKSK